MNETRNDRDKTQNRVSDSPYPTLPGIDISNALKRMGLSWDRFRKLLCDISQDQRVTYEKLSQAVKDGNDKNIRLFAHSIAGISANISAYDLQKAAKALQDMADANDKKELRSLFEAVEKEFRVVEDAIGSLGQNEKTSEDKNRKGCLKNMNDLLSTLNCLEESLNKLDPLGSSEMTKEILGHQLPDAMAQKIRKIDQLVDDFRFDEAGKILSEMIKAVKE